MPQSSLQVQAEASFQLKPHLCLASAPALSVSLTSLQISRESSVSVNHTRIPALDSSMDIDLRWKSGETLE